MSLTAPAFSRVRILARFNTASRSVNQIESSPSGIHLTKVEDQDAPPASARRSMVCALDPDFPLPVQGARFVGHYDGRQVISTSPVRNTEFLP